MKGFKYIILYVIVTVLVHIQCQGQVLRNEAQLSDDAFVPPDSLGDGLFRVRFINVYGCASELQSFDPEFNQEDLEKTLSLLMRIGGADRGLNPEFPSYSILTSLKEKKMMVAHGRKQLTAFEASIINLRNYQVSPEVRDFKDSILRHYNDMLKFEKIMFVWLKKGDNEKLRESILSMYSDTYMESTLDKVLAISDWNDRFKYTYNEVGAIISSRIYPNDDLLRLQTLLFNRYKLKVVSDGKCKR